MKKKMDSTVNGIEITREWNGWQQAKAMEAWERIRSSVLPHDRDTRRAFSRTTAIRLAKQAFIRGVNWCPCCHSILIRIGRIGLAHFGVSCIECGLQIQRSVIDYEWLESYTGMNHETLLSAIEGWNTRTRPT